MKILVVDDERTFRLFGRERLEVEYCRTTEKAFGLISSKEYRAVWLDHDMGNQRDGTWLTNMIERLAIEKGILCDVGEFVIHSTNPVARMKMAQALSKFYNVRFVRAEDYL